MTPLYHYNQLSNYLNTLSKYINKFNSKAWKCSLIIGKCMLKTGKSIVLAIQLLIITVIVNFGNINMENMAIIGVYVPLLTSYNKSYVKYSHRAVEKGSMFHVEHDEMAGLMWGRGMSGGIDEYS